MPERESRWCSGEFDAQIIGTWDLDSSSTGKLPGDSGHCILHCIWRCICVLDVLYPSLITANTVLGGNILPSHCHTGPDATLNPHRERGIGRLLKPGGCQKCNFGGMQAGWSFPHSPCQVAVKSGVEKWGRERDESARKQSRKTAGHFNPRLFPHFSFSPSRGMFPFPHVSFLVVLLSHSPLGHHTSLTDPVFASACSSAADSFITVLLAS